jgi:L-fuculose-phosphate aldolase
MNPDYFKEREEVAYFMRRLYQQKLTTTSGGNISFRLDEDNALITPSQLDKGRLSAVQIGLVGLDGENKTPELPLSMETGMHLAIYKCRPDIKAIVHAHPVVASSFAATDRDINCNLMGESRFVLGKPIKAKYALMGTPQLAEVVAEACLKTNVVLLENHGILAVGKTLLQAFDRLEVLEAAAKTSLIIELLGNKHELDKDQLREIDEMI